MLSAKVSSFNSLWGDLFSITSQEETVNKGRGGKHYPETSVFINNVSLKLTPVITHDNR